MMNEENLVEKGTTEFGGIARLWSIIQMQRGKRIKYEENLVEKWISFQEFKELDPTPEGICSLCVLNITACGYKCSSFNSYFIEKRIAKKIHPGWFLWRLLRGEALDVATKNPPVSPEEFLLKNPPPVSRRGVSVKGSPEGET
jgi:hypothetical protein